MPPKKRKYPEYCYDVVEEVVEEGRGARTARKRIHYFENKEKVAQYRRENDLDRLEAIQEKKKEEDRKKREEERKRKAAAAKKKSKPTPKKKKKNKPKAGEPEGEQDLFDFLAAEEKRAEQKELSRWERENRELTEKEKREKARRIEQKRRIEQGEDDLDDIESIDSEEEQISEVQFEPEEGEIIIEDRVPSLEDYFRVMEEQRQVRNGNNINAPTDDIEQEALNMIEAARHRRELDGFEEDRVPVGDSIYKPRTREERERDIIRNTAREEIKRERHSNYLITIVSNAKLKDYTPEEIEVLAAEMQYRVNEQLYLYAPDYIKFLEENDSLDLISRIEIFTKPERQEGRGANGQLHTHSIFAVTHNTRIHLDYKLINEIMQDVARDMGFSKKKDGGIAKFQVQIQRASDSAQGEYEYLAEDGVTYESGDISAYYEQAEAAIREGSMNREDLLKFKRRKKDVESAQRSVRELRGQA
jgi:hypothetical protein